MTKEEIKIVIKKQREFFDSKKTLDINTRLFYLKKLKKIILENEMKIGDAIRKDLGKSYFEGYMCEPGLVVSELSYMIKHTKAFSKEKNVLTPLTHFKSRSFKKPMPYGVVLIMSPWNYPFLLTMDPLIDAVASGNTVIVKPSAYSPHTSEVIREILENVFPKEYVCAVMGGREENNHLLSDKFDYIFFTGSKEVGKKVLEKASSYLTPATLELGGKSPCIIDKNANIKLAAKRVVFGKYLNCGQTCVAPDYIMCEESVKDEFLSYVKYEIEKQFGSDALNSPDYGKIINEKHFERITALIDEKKVYFGGGYNKETLKIEPTVMDNITWEDAVMKEEIFGPVMPVLTFNKIEDVINTVNSYDKPLALYVFSDDKNVTKKVMEECAFGGGCINDTIIHLATSNMGFGGVGESGMGSYHGKTGFDTFSHYKSIVDKKTWLDLPMRYQPYTKLYDKLIHMFLK